MRVLLGLWLGVMGAAGQVPDLFRTPGESPGHAPEVAAYSSEPFVRVGTIPTQSNARFFFAHPDGLRYYAISRTGPEGVWVISTKAPFPVIKKIPVMDAVAAAMSTDGRRIVMIGTNVLDLQTNTVTARIEMPYLPREEVAISHDSTRAYFLTISPGNLYSFDLRTNQPQSASISFQIVEGFRVAPNGLVDVTEGRYLVEVDGRSLAPQATRRLTPERTRGVGFSGGGE